MRLTTKSRFLAVAGILLISWQAHARPEYALQTHMNCTACHVNPWGGGPRTVFGKIWGATSRNLSVPKTSQSDLYYGDLRAIGYFPPHPSHASSGVALMEAAASANVPILQEDDGRELRVLGTYNMSPLQSGPREAYARWKPTGSDTSPVSYVMAGRFNSPFGLLTDEHRTYTRMQTDMTLNNYEMGGAASGDPIPDFHYDFALVNDFQGGGGTFVNNNVIWGSVANVRWMPARIPILLGVSQNYEHVLNMPPPFATSLYAGISLDRLTSGTVSGSLLFETVLAKNWNSDPMNPDLGPFFIPSTDSAYQTAVAGTRSQGYYAQAKYNLTAQWVLIYKFDYLVLDTSYPADYFARHGVGFETFLPGNVILDVRLEKAFVGVPSINGSTALAAQDDLFAMLRFWL